MDVVTAFLNPEVDGDVYMVTPDGIEVPAGGPLVCKLRKSLYGLKHAPRLWYEHIDNFLRSLGLLRSEYDPSFTSQPLASYCTSTYYTSMTYYSSLSLPNEYRNSKNFFTLSTR